MAEENILRTAPPRRDRAVAESRPDAAWSGLRTALLLVALVLFAANVTWRFPGKMYPDAINQLAQIAAGQLQDWQSPMMSVLWSVVLHITPGPAGMLVLQLFWQWLGLWLIADAMVALGRPRSAWLVLASGLTPLFLNYNGGMLSDVQLTSTLLASFGLVFWSRIRRPRGAAALMTLACVLLAYAALVRANAVFAFSPIALYFSRPHLKTVRYLVLCVLLSVAAIPISKVVNLYVIGAIPSGVERSLQLYDIAGVAHYSKDQSIFREVTQLPDADVDACFNTYWWDTFSYWGRCDNVWKGAAASAEKSPGIVSKLWIGSILAHPLAYLEHRLKHFNSMMFFLVPAEHARFVTGTVPGTPDADAAIISKSQILRDLAKRGLVFPFAWLLIAIGLLTLLAKRLVHFDQAPGAVRALLTSGILYTVFYLPISVATDMRYHLWLEATTPIALILLAPQLGRLYRQGDRWTIGWTAALLISLTLAISIRLVDSSALLH